MKKKDKQIIMETTQTLGFQYPEEANHGSRWSLWTYALNDGAISRELYDMAEEYYGDLWTYIGD